MVIEKYNPSKRSSEILEHMLKIMLIRLDEAVGSEAVPDISHYQQLVELRSEIFSKPSVNWSVELLASRINLSRYYFQKQYRLAFGVTCMQDVISSRMEHAKLYLMQQDLSVKSIAHTCGYNNEAHFMRQFKRFTGLTPSQYRNKQD